MFVGEYRDVTDSESVKVVVREGRDIQSVQGGRVLSGEP